MIEFQLANGLNLERKESKKLRILLLFFFFFPEMEGKEEFKDGRTGDRKINSNWMHLITLSQT